MSSALVITASYDKQVRFWDAASGRTVRCFVFQDSQINALLLIHDTHALVVAGFGVLRVYDVSSILAAGGSRSGPGAGAAAPMPQPGAQGQAPPLLSSYESQGSMNFTSLGYFPLCNPTSSPHRRSGSGASLRSDGDESGEGTDSSSNAGNDAFGRTISMILPSMMLAGAHPDVGVVLFATSEDGHIRFFDAKSPTALRLLKDIYTGAAITCSCLSPDRRYLLTGSQIGVVSVWHLPSIVANVSLGAGASEPEGLTAEQRAEFDAMRHDAQLFGSKPLQEISFEGDYTAIRSIAIDPLARWSVVATNSGNAHFLRFSKDDHLLGTKSAAAVVLMKAGSGGRDNSRAHGSDGGRSGAPPRMPLGFTLEDGQNDRHGGNGLSNKNNHGGSGGDDSNSLSHGGGGSSVLRLNGGGGGPGSESPSSVAAVAQGPREGVYRSALVVNELSNLARRGSQSSSSPVPDSRRSGTRGDGNGTNNNSASNKGDNHNSGGTGHRSSSASARGTGDGVNGIGTALLDSLEQQTVTHGSNSAAGGGQGSGDAAIAGGDTPQLGASAPGGPPDLPPPPPKARLQMELEMEPFYSFQAHYKYILKVAISPDGEQLVTCSADYTIGRFVVPQVLRETRDPETAAAAIAVAAATTSSATPSRQATATSGTDGGAAGAAVRLNAAMESSTTSAPHEGDETASPSFAGVPPVTETTGSGDAENSVSAKPRKSDNVTEMPGIDDAAYDPLSSKERYSPSSGRASGARKEGMDAAISNAAGGDEGAATSADTSAAPPAAVGALSAARLPQHYLFKPLKPLAGHNRWVWDCVFSDCCRFLFSCGSDAQVRMWNGLTTDRPQSIGFVGHTKPVVAILLCYSRGK